MVQLKNQIEALTFPLRGSDKDDMNKKPSAVTRKASHPDIDTSGIKSLRPPLQRPRSIIPCFIVMEKPIEKILIRFVLVHIWFFLINCVMK